METDHQQPPSLSDLCKDFFLLGLQIEAGKVELPDCEALKQRVLQLFETLKARARDVGIVPADVEEASFALAAYLDEIIQNSAWPGKQLWAASPLQALLFGESQAGTTFFKRLTKVRASSRQVLEVYYHCLVLGFMGEYRLGGGDQLKELITGLRRELGWQVGKSLSVHGVSTDASGPGRRSLALAPLAGLCVLAALVIVAVLYLVLSSTHGDAVELLQQIGRS